MKLPMKLSLQETDDILSSVGVFQGEINKKNNPETVKALAKLRLRLWTHLRKLRALSNPKRKTQSRRKAK